MLPLHPSSCLLQVVWPMKPLHSIRGSLLVWPPNGINHMLQQCLGYAADLSSPCYGQLYNASGVLVPALDMPPSPLLHQWTWSTLNWPLSKLIIITLSYNLFFFFISFSTQSQLYMNSHFCSVSHEKSMEFSRDHFSTFTSIIIAPSFTHCACALMMNIDRIPHISLQEVAP